MSQPRNPGQRPAPLEREAASADPDQLLDDDFVADPEKLAAARQRAREAPPANADPATLARFLAQRAQAASLSGGTKQALADLRRAAELAAEAPGVDRSGILSLLARAEMARGLRVSAINSMKAAVAATPPDRRLRLIPLYATLTQLYAETGNIPAAEQAFEQCRNIFASISERAAQRRGSLPGMQAHMMRARAALLDLKGQYEEAETEHRRLIAFIESTDSSVANMPPLPERIVALSRNLSLQNRLSEAETEARRALIAAQRHFSASSPRIVPSILTLARVLSDQGRTTEAENLGTKALDLLQAAGLSAAGRPLLTVAGILAAQERWAEAATNYDKARQNLDSFDAGEFDAAVANDLDFPLVLLKAGKAADAGARLQAMTDRYTAALGDKHYVTAEARGLHAMALAAQDRREDALRGFAAATPILLARSREADDDTGSATTRDRRLRLMLESYLEILLIPGKQGAAPPTPDAIAHAFTMAEAARGRTVQRAIQAAAARASTGDPELTELARKEQDATKEISALNGLLAKAVSARPDEQDAAAVHALRVRIDGLRERRAGLADELHRRFPGYGTLVNPRPATIADIQRSLRTGETLLSIYIGETRSYVWALPASGPPRSHAASLTRQQVRDAVRTLRQSLDPNVPSIDRLPPFNMAVAHTLYASLLQPVADAWHQGQTLFVVVNDALSQLPLSLLPTAPWSPPAVDLPLGTYRQAPWLIRQIAVAHLPASNALLTLRQASPGAAARRAFLAFGDPWFSREQATEAARQTSSQPLATRGAALTLRNIPTRGSEVQETASLGVLPRLPDTATEVRSIAAVLGAAENSDVFIGAAANETKLKQLDLSRWRVVMFATHGLVPGDLPGLGEPALALAAPEVAGGSDDGLLTMREILGLKLDADWVVLSACNTAAGQGAGAEAISGLGRAFFYAGSRALLVSNWPVETTSASLLTTDLFRRQAAAPSLGRAEALRESMLGLIDGPDFAGPDGKPAFAYAHPIFWAPFTLVGDGGRTGKN